MPQFERRLYEPTDDMRAFDASDEDLEEEGSRLPLLIVIALVVLASFAGVVWLAYTQGVQRGRESAPRVIAAQQNQKIAGAEKNPYAGLKIYQPSRPEDRGIDQDTAPPPAPTAIAPKAGTPSAAVVPPNKPAATSTKPAVALSPAANQTVPVKPLVTAQNKPVRAPKPTTQSAPLVVPLQLTARRTTAAPRIIAPPPTLKPTPKPSVPVTSTSTVSKFTPTRIIAKPTPAATPAAKPAKQTAALNPVAAAKTTTAPKQTTETQAGGFVLQIGSYKSEAEASASWQAYKIVHPAVAGYTPDIHRAELGAKGTWYRLRVGPFASLSEANAACAKVKSSGGNCFPAKR